MSTTIPPTPVQIVDYAIAIAAAIWLISSVTGCAKREDNCRKPRADVISSVTGCAKREDNCRKPRAGVIIIGTNVQSILRPPTETEYRRCILEGGQP